MADEILRRRIKFCRGDKIDSAGGRGHQKKSIFTQSLTVPKIPIPYLKTFPKLYPTLVHSTSFYISKQSATYLYTLSQVVSQSELSMTRVGSQGYTLTLHDSSRQNRA